MVGWESISLEDDTFKVCEVVIYAPRFLLLQRLLDLLAGCRKQERSVMSFVFRQLLCAKFKSCNRACLWKGGRIARVPGGLNGGRRRSVTPARLTCGAVMGYCDL